MTAPERVLFVGLDAMDRDLALDLACRGGLPTLASLIQGGARVPLATPPGLFVGAVWPTMTTGASPARHGRYCYAQLRPRTYEIHRVGGVVEPCLAFWTAAARAGRRTVAIDVPHSTLSDELAMHVVDWLVHDRNVGFRTWPDEVGTHLLAEHGRVVADLSDGYARRGRLGQLREDLLASIRAKAAFVTGLVERNAWDLLTVVFGESHSAGHQFWALHDRGHPRHDPVQARTLGDPLVEVYTALDAALGQIVSAAGARTLVLVVLSHGMGPHYDATFLLSKMLRRIEDADAPPPRHVVLREAARRRVRRAVRGTRRDATSFVSAVDGSRRFFAVPNNDVCGGIRINLQGREPSGRVRGDADFEATCALIEDGLSTWRNVETGAPLVRAITRTHDAYDGPARAHLPDLLVEWDRSAPIRSIASPRYGRIDREYQGVRTGDHQPGGLLIAYGPSVAPDVRRPPVGSPGAAWGAVRASVGSGDPPVGSGDPPVGSGDPPVGSPDAAVAAAGVVLAPGLHFTSADVAPTICAALGVPLPDVDGRPIDFGHPAP